MSVRTKVKVTLEILTTGKWGDKCTVDQVKRQSLDEATTILTKAMNTNPAHIRQISKVECINIIYSDDNI